MDADGTTNIKSLIYRKLSQDQNDGVMKVQIDKIRSERYGHLHLSAACVAASGDLSSSLCSFGTLTSGGVKFRLRTVVINHAGSAGNICLNDGGTTASTKRVARFSWSSGPTTAMTRTNVYTDIEGLYFKSDCRVIMSAACINVDITIGGILELTDGPY